MLGKTRRYWQEIMKPIVPPTWDDGSNEVLISTKHYKFRLFRGSGSKKEKVVMFPPYAGRDGTITNKLITLWNFMGYDVCVFDLLPANASNCKFSLDDLKNAGKNCYRFVKGPKILVGVCMGMWMSFLVVDGEEKPLAHFCFAGSADFHEGGGFIRDCVKFIPIEQFRFVMDLNGGVNPAWVQWWRFTSVNPTEVFMVEPIRLWKHICEGNEEGVASWHRNRNWFYSPRGTGSWFLEAVELFFMENRLKEMVDFDYFDWPLYLHAGEVDKIVHWLQTFSVETLAKSKKVTKHLHEKCGHTKCFNGKAELEHVRQDILDLQRCLGEVDY